MKKLIMAAAIVCAAVAANAASFTWMATAIYSAGSKTAYTGSVSLMAYADGAAASTATQVATATPSGNGSITKMFTSDTLTGGTKYNFYMVMSDKVGTDTYTFTSVTKSFTANSAKTTTIMFGSMVDTQELGNWKKVDSTTTPEPTSAMLLVLGVAGLALKRRRA